jgi:acyl carrier protein
MERQHVLNVVLKHLRLNVDGLDDVEVDASKSMRDYGASSLDIVEVVSSSMRELGIRVPTSALSRPQNINELVELFAESRAGSVPVS